MINFNATKEETALIVKILERAEKEENNNIIHMDSMMDIEACHSNGTPLNLQKFLDFDDFNFNHDFYGIRNHINRNTGKLENCFLPRCSA
jgi:hypothetical protein